ncbi:MAG: hypothetical protein SGPRY_008165 [Prymnesium sp.]
MPLVASRSPLPSPQLDAGAPLLVLLHGWLGDRRDLRPLATALSVQGCCSLLSIDLPLHGDSARLDATDGASEMADAIWAEITRCAPRGPIVLLGYSLGGRLALQLAERYASTPLSSASPTPQTSPIANTPPIAASPTIAGVIALSCNPGLEDEGERCARASRDSQLASRLQKMDVAQFVEWLESEWYAAPLWGRLRAHPSFADMRTRRAEGVRLGARAAALEQESVGRKPSLWRWVEAPPVPLLFACGEEDPTYAPMAERLARCLAGENDGKPPLLQVSLVPCAAHAVLLEAHEHVASVCLSFLSLLHIPRPVGQAELLGAGALRLSLPRVVPFTLGLTSPLPLSRGQALTERAGFLLLLSGASDHPEQMDVRGVSELCPLPYFHSESCEQAHEQLCCVAQGLAGRVVPYELLRLGGAMHKWLNSPSLFPSVRCAVELGLLHLLTRSRASLANGVGQSLQLSSPRLGHAVESHVRINGLLTRSEGIQVAQAALASAGSELPGSLLDRMLCRRTWKLKVGGTSPLEEGASVGRLVRVCEDHGLRLRLDANQAWGREDASQFCTALRRELLGGGDSIGRVYPSPALDFCEEPLQADRLNELAELYLKEGLKYAVDESVLPAAQEFSMAQHGKNRHKSAGPHMQALRDALKGSGCAALILKPTLLGGIEVTAALAAEAAKENIPCVLTSAFESGVAHGHIALMASALGGPSFAQGLSTYERLKQDVLMPPFAETVVGGDLIDIRKVEAALNQTADTWEHQ